MYGILAKYYDLFMQSVDYDEWIDFVAGFLKDKPDGIDMACGSGKFTIGLTRKGFGVFGVDKSVQMLSAARDNAQSSGLKIPFFQGDFCKFRPIKPVSFVTVMCDGINYVKTPFDAFSNLYGCLTEGGILIFDISSEYKLRAVIGNRSFEDSAENHVSYLWKNRLRDNPPRVEMETSFFLPPKTGSEQWYQTPAESQTQYIHTEAEIFSALKAAGFEDIRSFAGCSDQKPRPDTQRIHFIATKY